MIQWSFQFTPNRHCSGAIARQKMLSASSCCGRSRVCGAISSLGDTSSRGYARFHQASVVVPSERKVTLRQGFESSAASALQTLTHWMPSCARELQTTIKLGNRGSRPERHLMESERVRSAFSAELRSLEEKLNTHAILGSGEI